ncbi:MAG: metallophosphoesterase, partial [Firmicutes bacterium]|nr:metallophosphoesterase [Bacillota bacterium]
MNVKQFIKILLLAIFVCLAAGVGLFLYNANHAYNIRDGFSSVPLQFDPDDSSSTITWHGSQVTVHGGFVKGVQSGGFNGDSLVIRALSPLPSIEIKNGDQLYARTMSITLENVNPDFYAKQIDPSLSPSRTAVNTLEFTLDANPNAEINIVPATPS